MKYFYLFTFILIILFSCNSNKRHQGFEENSFFEYAHFINVEDSGNELIVHSSDHKTVFSTQDLPIQKVMVVPTSVIAYMDLLNDLEKITGVSQPDFIYNTKVQEKITKKEIEIIGSFDELFVERILLNKPDVLISTSSPTLAKFHTQLINEGVQIIFIDEYNELVPLAKAEYIKLFGILLGKEQESEKIFQEIKSNYASIRSQLKNSNTTQPKVLLNQMYGDIWYMPRGESFQSNFIADANGDYLWKNTPGKGVQSLNFEQVFERAHEAEYWLNAGDFPSLESLLASYKNYEWLPPAQNQKVYNWYKRTTPKGANDYFEMGTARPDWVLKDLVKILHPEIFPNEELYFYKKLE